VVAEEALAVVAEAGADLVVVAAVDAPVVVVEVVVKAAAVAAGAMIIKDMPGSPESRAGSLTTLAKDIL
jgi:molybdopterin-guanine dinucleotide biosynthesis protein A